MSLEIYPVVLELVRRLSPLVRVLRARSSALADQMERALISIPLNVAEGAYSRGKNRQARFQSAAASARETLACLETAEAMGFHRAARPGARRAIPPRHRYSRPAHRTAALKTSVVPLHALRAPTTTSDPKPHR
jgi:four helix bundle protein